MLSSRVLTHIALLSASLHLPTAAASEEAPPADDSSADAPQPHDQDSDLGSERRARVDSRQIERLERSYAQRSLAHHPFVTPQFVQSALPTSHVGTRLGAGAVLQTTEDPSTGESQTSHYVAGMGRMEAGVRFGKWVGIEGHIDGAAGVGSEGASALDVGAAAGYAWDAGALIRVVHGRATALSIRPGISGTSGTGLDLRPGLTALTTQLESGEQIDFSEASRYMVTRSWSVGADLSLGLAQALGRRFGLQLGVSGGYASTGQSYYDGAEQTLTASRATIRGGGALSFDANPIPLAVMLEYAADVGVGIGAVQGFTAVGHAIGAGIYLNGMTNTVGLELSGVIAEEETRLGARIGFRSYF